jgi:cell division protein ZapA
MESLQITIGNRTYPLTVPAEEAEAVRSAARQVNEHLKRFKEQYGVDDPIDLLAMSALQWATQAMGAEKPAPAELSEAESERIADLLKRMQAEMGT